SGRFRVALISRALSVCRSNIHEQLETTEEPMKREITKLEDGRLLPMIRELTDQRPTYGYRRITAILRRKTGETINAKRVYRIMRQNGLCLQRYTGRPVRSHEGRIETIRSDVRWCSDAFGIQCWNGEQLQVAFSLDCHDRELITYVTSTRGIDGELVRDLMTETIEQRFGQVDHVPHPVQWLSDNGPCYTAHETVGYGRLRGLDIRTTPSYSPESNGMAEGFVKTFKRDYVWFGDLSSADRVREQLAAWFEDYNENAPHKALKMKSPRAYRRELNNRAG
ncbi:MAG: IS3 family transposase, partial [Bdellovibrionales bacterium]